MAPTSIRQLILGSTSPYRRMLLDRLCIPYSVQAPKVDETPLSGERPEDLARRLAKAKAMEVAQRFRDCIVIGSDQVADMEGQPLGKPGTHERAVAQLRQMSGKAVVFQSAVAVVCLDIGFSQEDLAPVKVTFRTLSNDEIEIYLKLEQPYDCAGSAKSEGLGILLLHSIESDDPTALVGLPLIRTCKMLRAAGMDLFQGKRGAA
jgi:septum formation protein